MLPETWFKLKELTGAIYVSFVPVHFSCLGECLQDCFPIGMMLSRRQLNFHFWVSSSVNHECMFVCTVFEMNVRRRWRHCLGMLFWSQHAGLVNKACHHMALCVCCERDSVRMFKLFRGVFVWG